MGEWFIPTPLKGPYYWLCIVNKLTILIFYQLPVLILFCGVYKLLHVPIKSLKLPHLIFIDFADSKISSFVLQTLL